MAVMMGVRLSRLFKGHVGRGSSPHDFDGDALMILATFSSVTGVKDEQADVSLCRSDCVSGFT